MTTDPPADQYYLYVLALSKQVTLTQLVTALAERLGPLQMVELVTVPQVTAEPQPDPWWWALAPGDRVTITAATTPITGADGRQIVFSGKPMARAAGQVLDVVRAPTDADRVQGRLMVYPDKAPFPGGLFVSAGQVKQG